MKINRDICKKAGCKSYSKPDGSVGFCGVADFTIDSSITFGAAGEIKHEAYTPFDCGEVPPECPFIAEQTISRDFVDEPPKNSDIIGSEWIHIPLRRL